MIARFDDDIRQLLEQLRKINQTSNTVIFFTSDTGPAKAGGIDPKFLGSTGPFRGVRGDLNEGGLRVPMIVCWPAKPTCLTCRDASARRFAVEDFNFAFGHDIKLEDTTNFHAMASYARMRGRADLADKLSAAGNKPVDCLTQTVSGAGGGK